MKISFVGIALILLSSIWISGSVLQAYPQQKASHRQSFGDTRATLMESLLQSIFSGAKFRWAPDLQVQESNGSFVSVQFPGLTFSVTEAGLLYGASGLELANEKEEAIFNAKQIRKGAPRNFATTVVTFRANPKGNVTQSQRFELDPTDPLAEIKIIRIQDWKAEGWPVLQIQYVSHIPSVDSYTQIEWQSSFDSNSRRFVSRLPLGIETRKQNGEEQTLMFSIHRVSPTEIEINDTLNKIGKRYSCSDPCVVGGPTLLAKWVN